MYTLNEFQNKIKAIMEGTDLPYRNRVEVFAVKNGKVYGGFYDDGTFGTFGGGLDGDAIEDGARREFKEETGYSLKNVERLDIPALEVCWKTKPKTVAQEERQKKYKGTRTWFYYAELGTKGAKASGEDGQSQLQKVGLIDIETALKSLDKTGSDDSVASQMNARKKALKLIQSRLDEE